MPKGIKKEVDPSAPKRVIPLSQSVLWRSLRKTPVCDTAEKRKALLTELHIAVESKGGYRFSSLNESPNTAKNLNAALTWADTPQGSDFWHTKHRESGLPY